MGFAEEDRQRREVAHKFVNACRKADLDADAVAKLGQLRAAIITAYGVEVWEMILGALAVDPDVDPFEGLERGVPKRPTREVLPWSEHVEDVRVAFRSYRCYFKDCGLPHEVGFINPVLAARHMSAWHRSKRRPVVKRWPHSPGRYRVNGVRGPLDDDEAKDFL